MDRPLFVHWLYAGSTSCCGLGWRNVMELAACVESLESLLCWFVVIYMLPFTLLSVLWAC